ncbi:hypothetical protein BU14_0197s0007 [Porphyra umbilicalis]|uniref:Uncharacterized protein n=1 Tax=Porphyra umbilicalis TaxID=2786 RepID=A0A1X6P5Y0_PORUM|nr:hypothetical protein BU14_0197s0007 [Porphyra umbilicalis]|eukprot:OSX76311.1 hypothetical protein BU14_0197s0007 [Porphyra umbilicalis]
MAYLVPPPPPCARARSSRGAPTTASTRRTGFSTRRPTRTRSSSPSTTGL